VGVRLLYRVGVLEPISGRVTALIEDWLVERGDSLSLVLTRGECPHCFSGEYDLFVLAPADGTFRNPDPLQDIRCKALLAPSDRGAEALGIQSKWVVSYGLAVRDSLTVSSLEPDLAVLALQREIPTLRGTVVERQEVPLPIPPGSGAGGVMALYGSLLILGVPPEELAL